jgi:hypothetical protein
MSLWYCEVPQVGDGEKEGEGKGRGGERRGGEAVQRQHRQTKKKRQAATDRVRDDRWRKGSRGEMETGNGTVTETCGLSLELLNSLELSNIHTHTHTRTF